MPRSRNFERVAVSALLVVALVAFVLQLVFDQPVVGALGLVLLAVPGYAISRTVGPRPLGWPAVTFVALGSSVAITVLAGTLAGLAPAGLHARTIAIVEVAIVAALSIAWVRRVSHGFDEGAAGALSGRPGRPARVALGTLLLGGIAVILAGTGVAVATRAARDQAHPEFVQFWSLPANESIGASVGIRNMAAAALDCVVTIDRPDRQGLTWNAGSIPPGQTALGLLPRADADETSPWRLELSCAGAGDEPIERLVSIEPPR
jgi:hypothetical protein